MNPKFGKKKVDRKDLEITSDQIFANIGPIFSW